MSSRVDIPEADSGGELLDAGLECVVTAHRAQQRLAEMIVRHSGHGASVPEPSTV
jgi:hypothetical protein